MDAGGLAQMSYPGFPSNGALGVPGSGFASRGKGSHIARLTVAQPASAPGEAEAGRNGGNATSTPRTSRSHLLANLRTAPKSPAFPPSAPPTQLRHNVGLGGSKYADAENTRARDMAAPKTSIGNSFPAQSLNGFGPMPMTAMGGRPQMYSTPDQVLAPPSIHVGSDQGDEQMDPALYAELVATNLYLAQQQQRLQQQLIHVTAAAQQFGGLNMNETNGYAQPQVQQPGSFVGPTPMNFRTAPNMMQPVVSPVPGAQPGLYSVYNPMTGQQGFFVDQNSTSVGPVSSPTMSSPEQAHVNASRTHSMSPPVSATPPAMLSRQTSSPKPVTSPMQTNIPLASPSNNAFRRNHKPTSSNVSHLNVVAAPGGVSVSKTAGPKSAGFPVTPMTGTFGPGQGRAGEHPVRQPRGPPPLEELMAHPTTKHEGSKNFATRQRRRAVHSLVRAGIERRGGRSHGSTDSTDSMTPVSEAEITFSIASDNETESLGSGDLSGKPSLGSLRAVASGAIGSERKELKERSRERDSLGSHHGLVGSSTDDAAVGKATTNGQAHHETGHRAGEARKTPLLVLTSAEKRKSAIF